MFTYNKYMLNMFKWLHILTFSVNKFMKKIHI